MDILVIGGTQFVGYHLVSEAIARGHQVTLFNRGRSNPGAFETCEHIIGDRNVDVVNLTHKTYDAIIDTCGYTTKQVADAVNHLQHYAGWYVFVSTISVYRDMGGDEDGALQVVEPDAALSNETYGGLKVHGERTVRDIFPDKHIITRPGLIVGPRDVTNRFGYWPLRIAEGGDVLAPLPKTDPVQFIDARDLAAFTLLALERGKAGTYNVAGPLEPLSIGEFLETTRKVINPDAQLTWVGQAFLQQQDVSPWVNLPLWLPSEETGGMRTQFQRALDVGLTFRPLEDTLRDTLNWLHTHADLIPERTRTATLSRERERELLKQWHVQNDKNEM
jgi:2'-hydroxyisoflavone reductase